MNILASGQVFDVQEFAEKVNLTPDEVELVINSVTKHSNLKMLDCKSGTVWDINAVVDEDYVLPPKEESVTFE